MKGKPFNAKAARAKRPCPIWADAFLRDTAHLEADEVGAYFLILMAMWTRESCDLPDDDMRLARVARVSPTLWTRRIGPVIRAFLQHSDGFVVSKRLREEASFVEHGVGENSRRKKGKLAPKSLNNNKCDTSADVSTDVSADDNTQLPNYPTVAEGVPPSTKKEEEERARDLLERVKDALGVTRSDEGQYWSEAAAIPHIALWSDLGLSDDEIVSVASSSRSKHPDPPDGPKALDRAMEAYVRAKSGIARTARRNDAIKPSPPVDETARDTMIADWVKRGTCPSSMLRPDQARGLLAKGLVGEADLKRCGIAW